MMFTGFSVSTRVLSRWGWTSGHTHFVVKFIWEIKKLFWQPQLSFLLFHHIKSIPSVLKYEVMLISIITWNKNVDIFQCIYKIFTFWNLSFLLMRNIWFWKHQLTENFLAAKTSIVYWALKSQFHRVAIFCFLGYLSFEMPALCLVIVVVWKLTSRKKGLGEQKETVLVSENSLQI